MAKKYTLKMIFAKENKRLFQIIWLVVVLIYDIFRAFLVEHFFSDYGVSGVKYFIFEIIASIFFSMASFRLVENIIYKRTGMVCIYFVLTAVTFFSPDLYVLIVSDKIPKSLLIGIVGYLSVSTTVTIISMTKKAKAKKQTS